MPAPQPTAPYDALTAEARELLFRIASYPVIVIFKSLDFRDFDL